MQLPGSLVIRISRLGRYIAPQYAHRYFDTATVGIAFTADNLFEHCLSNHLPWDISKGFDGAAAVGQFQPVADLNLPCASFMLKDNGQVVQQSSNENANFSLAEIVSHVSQFSCCAKATSFTMVSPVLPQKPRQIIV